MADEESYLDKIGSAIRKYTGGDYVDRTKERARKKLEELAPGSVDVIDKGAWALEQTPMIGMARAKSVKAAKDVVETAKRVRGISRAEKVAASGPKTRKPVSGGTSYSASSLEKTRTRPRTEKEANKFGPLAKRKENLPVPRKENLPAVVREENRGIVPYKRPGELARYEDRSRQVRTFGDKAAKVDNGRIVGLSRMGKVAVGGAGAGLGALGYALSPDAKKAGAGGSSASGESRVYGGARPGEKTMGYGGRSATSGGKEDMQKRPEERKPVKAAGDKSRVAKKMTNFERMKQRQYEKEGVGGRSVTAEGARKRVVEERKYKPLAGLKSASLRSGSSGSSNRSKLAAAFRKKMQGRAK